jgi:uncharacterized membrane protein
MEHEGQQDQQEALKLHRLLERRAAPPDSPWLASRIIEATAQSVSKRRVSSNTGIAELLAEIIPRPTYALASALLLGFLCGMIAAIQESLKASSLPKARQAELQVRLAAVREQSRITHRKAQASRDALLDILAAPVFDEAAYNAQIKNIHALHGQQLKLMSKTIKEMAREMSPPERTALADTLRCLSKKKR